MQPEVFPEQRAASSAPVAVARNRSFKRLTRLASTGATSLELEREVL